MCNLIIEKLDENLLYDVLQTAEMYLLPGLKRKCASELAAHHLTKENLFDFLRIARLYDLKKLEFACISFLASFLLEVIFSILDLACFFRVKLHNIEDNFVLSKFANSEDLRELILEDAAKLKMRQETDTIDIVDDLRYSINGANTTRDEEFAFDRLLQREKKLHLIDELLKELNLEC